MKWLKWFILLQYGSLKDRVADAKAKTRPAGPGLIPTADSGKTLKSKYYHSRIRPRLSYQIIKSEKLKRPFLHGTY